MEGLFTPPESKDDGIRTSDTNDLIRKYIEYKGLVSDHIDSFNDIVDRDLNDVFERTYRTTERTVVYTYKKGKNNDISTVKIEPRYTNIVVHPPQMTKRETGTKIPLMPSYARLNNRYYVAPFTGDFHCKLTATKHDGTEIVREEHIRDVEITSLPIPERSNRCPLSEMSFEVQMNTGEDPLSPGGFFPLINEWIVNHIENLKYNELRAFNNKHDGMASRAEMLSKLDNTNGNSAQFIIKIMDTGELTVVIDHKPFRNFSFPFYTLFKILGAETQRDIVDSIVYGEYESAISKYIQARLTKAFNVKYKQFPQAYQHLSLDNLRHYIISFMDTEFNKAGKDVFEKNKNVWYADLYNYIDRYFMPHIGQLETDRIAKYKALGFFIRYLFLVHMGVYEQTDRDSELSKRNERSGQRMVKMLKTYINSTIARPLLDAYEHALKHMAFEDIDIREIHNNACDSDRLKKIHIRLITGGSKKVIKTGGRGKPITNRLHTQQRNGGHLNTIANLRQIVSNPTTAASKQSEREHKMRQVHSSSFGYKCPVQTQESENIGLNKEMAITCNITSNSSISVLLSTLAEETKTGLIIKDPEGPRIVNEGLTRVTINWSGITVGWTATPYLLVDKYRYLRRKGKVDKTITIHWDVAHDMVIFYCDGERVIRPMVIVYNNYGDSYTSKFCKNKKDLSDFKQWIGLRKSHMTLLRLGKITIVELMERGLIEYIAAEEQSEMLIAHSPDYLIENENNHMFRYTHVEMPSALYGLPALIGVNANLNPGTRNTFHTNHCRQAAGEYAWNWRNRKDKGIGLQTFNELSPVYTIANKLTISAGVVCRVDIICDRYNQEDSQSFNAAIVDSGKFMIEAFDKISCSLGNDEEFRLPTPTNSTRKIHANYATVSATMGMPLKDTILRKGDVVIAKVHKQVNKNTGETKYVDRSVIYTNMEPGIVLKTLEFRNEDDVPIREVQIIKTRNPVLGDKFSMKGTAQVLTNAGWIELQNLDPSIHQVATLKNDGVTLDYVVPSGLSKYEYDGKMYCLESQQLNMCVTENHKLYVKRRGRKDFELLRTPDVFGRRVRFKRDAKNDVKDQDTFIAKTPDGNAEEYSMDAWLQFLGAFISGGFTKENKLGGGTREASIQICASEQRKKNLHHNFLKDMKVHYYTGKKKTGVSGFKYPGIYTEMKKLSVGAPNKFLPDYAFELSQRQSQLLIANLVSGDGTITNSGTSVYFTSSKRLANDISRLALHAGWSANIKCRYEAGHKVTINGRSGTREITSKYDQLAVHIVKKKNSPQINHGHVHNQRAQKEYWEEYKGTVYCLEVPNTHTHVYYAREGDYLPPCWSGNSSRAGQKGVLGVQYAPNDMYFDEFGGCADIIINPHCLSGDTMIELADGDTAYIKDIYDKDYEIVTVDPATLEKSVTRYTNGFEKKTTEMVEVATSSGRKIKCTPEHLLLVLREEKLQWIESATLIPDEDRLIVSHNVDPVSNDNGDILTVEKQTGAHWDKLERIGLTGKIPNHKTKILARLLGAIESDGHLQVRKESKSGSVRCMLHLGEMDDYDEICYDMKTLGAKQPSCYAQKNCYRVELDIAIGVLLMSLGACVGNKTKSERKFPEWINTMSSAVKREFLSGYQGGDGSKVSVNKHTSQQQVRIRGIRCRTANNVKDSHNAYLGNIVKLLSEFGIKSTLREVKCPKDNNSDLMIYISLHPDNLIKMSSMIAYRYCNHKRRESIPAIEFLREKISGSKDKYDIFLKQSMHGKYITSSVKSVTSIEPELVYDFTTVSKNHSFIANGIVSHNCIPTRMTISQMTESILSMIHAMKCSSIDGTIHTPIDVNKLPEMLKEMGMHPDGTSQLYNPSTGVAMKTRTFRGLVYYQNLQKFTQDKRYAVESGPTDIITRQPLEGKSVDGGLRIGEMERDVLLAIGATMFIAEKYYYHSNPATIYVCENCGTIPTVNTKYGVSCLMCRDNARAYAVDTTWSSWVFMKEIRTLNFKVRLELADHIYRR